MGRTKHLIRQAQPEFTSDKRTADDTEIRALKDTDQVEPFSIAKDSNMQVSV